MTLYPYQTNGINEVASLYSSGVRKILFQLATGGGKTVCFSALIQRFLKAYPLKSSLVLVHRDELLKQSRKTLYNNFNILSEPIVSGKKSINKSQSYVAMVETIFNRLSERPRWAEHIGLLIVDECHLGNFKKIYDFFPNALIVGFSATPISATKKDPLHNYFDEIVTGPGIEDLIKQGSLSSNQTYSIKGIDRKMFKSKGADYDTKQMGDTYSNGRNVLNTVEAYTRLCKGKKTIVFNCNVEHSLIVTEAFRNAGFNCRHLDGKSTNRAETLAWFKSTDDAILCNVDVATTGFDEPSIHNVIVNRSTKSLTLWLQMTGRGSRIFDNKDFFTIVDMGGNALIHLDWRVDRDWKEIFRNPDKPSNKESVAPLKSCEGCEALLPASTIKCAYCGHEHVRTITYDTIAPEFELLVGRIDVSNIVQKVKDNGQKEWKGFFEILNIFTTQLKYKTMSIDLNQDDYEKTKNLFLSKVSEWCKQSGKPFSRSVKEFAVKNYDEAIQKMKKQMA